MPARRASRNGRPRNLNRAYPFIQVLLLTGQGDGVGGATANLAEGATLTDTAAGVGGATANLTAGATLTATAAGVGAASANLTQAAILVSTAAGLGAATVNLTEAAIFTGTAAGIGGGSGAVSETLPSLPPPPPPPSSPAHNTYIGSSGGFIAPELWRNFLRRTFGIRNFWRYDQALMLLVTGEIDEDEFIAMVSSIREYLAS
jgi:hypothetical protein